MIILLNESVQTLLVLFHGGPGMDPSYFQKIAEPLSKHASVVSYTQGYTGATDIDGLIEEFERTISPLAKGRKIVLLGHSWGAALALEIFKRKGRDAIEGIILVSPVYDSKWAPEIDEREKEAIERAVTIAKQKLVEMGKKSDSNEFYRQLTLALTPLYFTEEFEREGREILSGINYNMPLFEKLDEDYLRNCNHMGLIQANSDKCLVLSGAQDRVTTQEYVKRLGDDVEIVIFDGIGHFPFIESPDSFEEEVKDFVTRPE